ncbi:MAG TPA: hypothetical protein VLJ62_22470, partial [Burkholderiaceae bacterium]|nr:hypothetical protein [Burkholderiaceae bacterium]
MMPVPIGAGDAAPGYRRVLVWLWHELRIGLPISLIATVFISTLFRDSFLRTLVYSLCIGLSIQFLIEAGRYGGVAWLRRRDPLCLPSQAQWPGWGLMGPWLVVSALIGYFGGSLLGDLLTGE